MTGLAETAEVHLWQCGLRQLDETVWRPVFQQLTSPDSVIYLLGECNTQHSTDCRHILSSRKLCIRDTILSLTRTQLLTKRGTVMRHLSQHYIISHHIPLRVNIRPEHFSCQHSAHSILIQLVNNIKDNASNVNDAIRVRIVMSINCFRY